MTILVAIADVDALVKPGTAVDRHAQVTTPSRSTRRAIIFPMLPASLSTNLTSLADGQDRLAIAIEIAIDKDGAIWMARRLPRARPQSSEARLSGVAAWLEAPCPMPEPMARVPGLDAQIRAPG